MSGCTNVSSVKTTGAIQFYSENNNTLGVYFKFRILVIFYFMNKQTAAVNARVVLNCINGPTP